MGIKKESLILCQIMEGCEETTTMEVRTTMMKMEENDLDYESDWEAEGNAEAPGDKAAFFSQESTRRILLKVSSQWEEDFLIESGAHTPVLSPIQTASPPPPICPPPPPSVMAPPPPPSAVSASPTPLPPVMAPAPPPVKPPRTILECIPQCMVRCKNHSRKNICMRTCLTCCNRCKCVPPGQYGNKEKCGKCYTDMTTRGGKLKCP